MTPKYQETGSSGPKVPAYIVTFSDMTTLLLTFFVMLLSLSQVRDEELFSKGRESLLRSIKLFGLGALHGKRQKPNFGHPKTNYFIHRPDKSFAGRTIDAKEEKIRRIFKRVRQHVKTMPSQMVAKQTNFSVTDIRFGPGRASLDESAKRFLSKFCMDLPQDPASAGIKFYVFGLAGDEPTEKEQWILSARRARAVAEFLQKILPANYKWPVCSWGAGPGGDWVSRDSPIYGQSQILIAVLRAK